MKTFLLFLMFTFPLVLIMAFMINFARRRLRRTRHGLTGMCHKDGGAMCCSCPALASEPDAAPSIRTSEQPPAAKSPPTP
jgi:hypothetical protein